MHRGTGTSRTGDRYSRWASVWRGAGIGVCVGVAWTAVIGPLTDGPPSIWLSLAVYAVGLATTGAVIGAVRHYPELIGMAAGFSTLAVLAVVVGPSDPWAILWLLFFGATGLLLGPIIGVLYRLSRRR